MCVSGWLFSSGAKISAKACSSTSTFAAASVRTNNCSAPASRQFSAGLTAAGADRQRRDLVGAFHRGILRGIGAQHLLLGWIGMGFGDRLKPDRLDLLELNLHLRHRDLLGWVHPALDRRRARYLA